jgi:SAM-dependent methyltransferase
MKGHWEGVYDNNSVEELGWYEASPEPSLNLIERCRLKKEAAILNVGAGATTLVDELLEIGYSNIIANDISRSALEELKLRLGADRSEQVRWIVDDLTEPKELAQLGSIDLWHDRAVLHFFQDRTSQDAYFKLMHKLVKPGGFVIIATFNLNGASTCSGLPVFRYNAPMLKEKAGDAFQMLEAFDYTYTQPSGHTREYVYTMFQRIMP